MNQPTPPRQSLASLLRAPAAVAAPVAAEVPVPEVPAPASTPASTPASAPAPAPAPATLAPVTSAAETTAAAEPTPAAGTAVAAPGEPAATPGFLRQPARGPVSTRWQWALAGALGLLLLAQVVLAERATLAANAQYRPWLQTLCSLLACRLPAWQEPEAFTMLERSVLPVPGQAGTLQVEASFRNDAQFAQALPLVELTLSTADGQVSGQRIFSPAEYMGQASPGLLEPGQSAQARFQLVEPEPAAEAFHFRFR